MFLAEPPSTAYDFRFQLFGIPIRVTPFFWLASALLGWDWAAGLDREMQRAAAIGSGDLDLARLVESNPGQGVLLLVWIAAVFVSILIHELGHALAMRRYGISSYVVLYHFGGLAIPDRGGTFVRTGAYAQPPQQIVIAAAGPAAQLMFAAILIVALRVSGFALLFDPINLPYVSRVLSVSEGQQITSLPLQATVLFLLMPSVFWALLNLLPVYPLDGGQIARELFTLYSPRDGVRNSLILSVSAGAAVAIYAFLNRDLFLAMLFGLLAFSSYQILQAYSGRGGGFGGPW